GGWRPEPESLEVAGIVRESWGLVADRAAAQGVDFEVVIAPDAGQVHADPVALRQVLSNLLDNALRYTPPGGRITVTARHDPGGVGLAVRDTGIGVTREHLPRIFERFYRADAARSRDQGGTGLGLAIVRHLVEAHGGQVSAESELGRGTEIRCWFPDAPAALTVVTRS
ncbi:MAG TPA: ATP-binding protein, partial [Gemmatimonadales bacterium]|nr:ATP-binding protein [Gemmatimonadales bacterium]